MAELHIACQEHPFMKPLVSRPEAANGHRRALWLTASHASETGMACPHREQGPPACHLPRRPARPAAEAYGSRNVVWQVRSRDPSSSLPVMSAEALPVPGTGSR